MRHDARLVPAALAGWAGAAAALLGGSSLAVPGVVVAVAAVTGVDRDVQPVGVFAGGLIRRRSRRAQQRRRQHQREKDR